MSQTTTADTAKIPTRIEPYSATEMFIAWNSGQSYRLPYMEIRFQCPCASCVDENTGKRVIKREDVALDIKPTGVQVVGRYALQISWNDGHQTGMYHFDRMAELCQKQGQPL